MQENLSLGFSNNKDSDQHAHPPRLISGFAIGFLESIMSELVTGKFPRDWFESHFVGNPKDRFCPVKAHILIIECGNIKDLSDLLHVSFLL